MKKIMFIIAIAILFASCGNPVMPVDDTDNAVVGTWYYDADKSNNESTNDVIYKFNANGSGTQKLYLFTGWGNETSISWTAFDGIITINGVDQSYGFNGTNLVIDGIEYRVRN